MTCNHIVCCWPNTSCNIWIVDHNSVRKLLIALFWVPNTGDCHVIWGLSCWLEYASTLKHNLGTQLSPTLAADTDLNGFEMMEVFPLVLHLLPEPVDLSLLLLHDARQVLHGSPGLTADLRRKQLWNYQVHVTLGSTKNYWELTAK